jgi:hypothetical protein
VLLKECLFSSLSVFWFVLIASQKYDPKNELMMKFPEYLKLFTKNLIQLKHMRELTKQGPYSIYFFEIVISAVSLFLYGFQRKSDTIFRILREGLGRDSQPVPARDTACQTPFPGAGKNSHQTGLPEIGDDALIYL